MKARVITAEQYKQYLQYTTEESWLLLLAGDPLPFAEGQGEGREEGMAAEPVAKKRKVGIREEGRAGGGQLYTCKGPLVLHDSRDCPETPFVVTPEKAKLQNPCL